MTRNADPSSARHAGSGRSPTTIPWRKHGILAMLLALLTAISGTPNARGHEPAHKPEHDSAHEIVIVDDDWNIDSGGFVSEPFLPMLLQDQSIKLAGLTAVTGDNWRDEGMASLLRFLELIGHPDIAVYPGANTPSWRSYDFSLDWQRRYGAYSWNGAWNSPAVEPRAHPRDPDAIIPPVWGTPSLRPAQQNAADFMIATIHAHPGRVTLFTAGPLTTIAEVVRKDHAVPGLVKALIVCGTNIPPDLNGPRPRAAFNMMFDPEAAKIVFSARWKSLVMPQPMGKAVLDQTMLDRIGHASPLIRRYEERSGGLGLPLWGVANFAAFTDPASITGTAYRQITVTVRHDAQYGILTATGECSPSDTTGPAACARLVQVDQHRAITDWLASLSSIRPSAPPSEP